MLGLDYLEELKETAKLPRDFEELIDADDLAAKLDLIKLQVIKVTMYAVSHEEPFLKDVINEMEKSRVSGKLYSYYTQRLPSNDLFCCLRLLPPKCLWIVLEKLKTQHIGIVEDLMNAVLNNDFNGYRDILTGNDINIETITPISKLLFIKIRLDRLLNSFIESVEKNETLDEKGVLKDKELRNLLLQFLSENKGIMRDITPPLQDSVDVFEPLARNIIDDDGFRKKIDNETFLTKEEFMEPVIKGLKNDYPNFNEEDLSYEDYMNLVYMDLLQDYYEGVCNYESLSTFAKHVIENILKLDVFKPIWSRYDKFDKDMWDDLGKRIDEFFEKHGMIDEEEQEESATSDDNQTTESNAIITTQKAQQADDDSEIQDFRDATFGDKANELYNVIEELLNEIEGREHEFFGDNYDLNDLKAIFESILKYDAGENIDTQQAIIEELAGTDKRITPRYYHEKKLWLQPFFIILGHLYNKGVWKGDQLSFVRALFSDKPYKYDKEFINTCRAKISLGNTTLFKKPEDSKNLNVKWKTWFEWIDTLL